MISAGIDIGSVATKAVIVRSDKVVGRAIERSGAEPQAAAQRALDAAIKQAGFEHSDITHIIATGYGRRSVNFAEAVITEITADARGACHTGAPWGTPRLIVDLGGQDTKVILLDEKGAVADFVMNDKCAAGTGRFLEVMADILEAPIECFGELAAKSKNPAQINSTCTVFAESEVISLISAGASREDIIAGLHRAIASRIAQMVKPMGEHDIFFNGGGALNAGVSRALEQATGRKVYVPPLPQFVIALGAALSGDFID